LVWLGSPATEHYVAKVASALLEINRRTGALLTLISGSDRSAALDPLRHMLQRVPWAVGTFASDLASADVAIAPLDDSPYSRGKCAYKLLQYAAAGLPLSQVLAEASSTRAARAATGGRAVKAHYSFDAWKSRWCNAMGVIEGDYP
jgi:hypothetical protein